MFWPEKNFLRKTTKVDELQGNSGNKLWNKNFPPGFLLYRAFGKFHAEGTWMSSNDFPSIYKIWAKKINKYKRLERCTWASSTSA